MHTFARETTLPILGAVLAAAAFSLAGCNGTVPTPFGSMPAAQGVAADCAAASAAIGIVQTDAQATRATTTANGAATALTLLTTDCAAIQAGLAATQAAIASGPSAYVAAEATLAEAKRKLEFDAVQIAALPGVRWPSLRW